MVVTTLKSYKKNALIYIIIVLNTLIITVKRAYVIRYHSISLYSNTGIKFGQQIMVI